MDTVKADLFRINNLFPVKLPDESGILDELVQVPVIQEFYIIFTIGEKMKRTVLTFIALLFPLLCPAEDQPKPFQPENGDTIVFLGGTLIERAQQYGFWESMIISELPDKELKFRNLGWDGDTVFAESRGIFDPPAEGYKRMIERIKKINPQYIFISYGGNESFKGPDGIAPFLNQFEILLRDVKGEKTEVILISPIKFEKMAPPLPDPTEANKNRELYIKALGQFAEVHHLPLLDLFTTLNRDDQVIPENPNTYNGIHLTPAGYHLTSHILKDQIFSASENPELVLNSNASVQSESGIMVDQLKKNGEQLEFKLSRKSLPHINEHGELEPSSQIKLAVNGLSKGTYSLSVDGEKVKSATAEEWSQGIHVGSPSELKQASELNELVLKKNELYFHSWRPQNITYLFGFRKHEQGQNAKEVDEMMELVRQKEAEIYKLQKNRTFQYVLTKD